MFQSLEWASVPACNSCICQISILGTAFQCTAAISSVLPIENRTCMSQQRAIDRKSLIRIIFFNLQLKERDTENRYCKQGEPFQQSYVRLTMSESWVMSNWNSKRSHLNWNEVQLSKTLLRDLCNVLLYLCVFVIFLFCVTSSSRISYWTLGDLNLEHKISPEDVEKKIRPCLQTICARFDE